MALLKSQEKAEDDTIESVNDLKKIIAGDEVRHVVYIGITCGLSAPYVGSQIQWILDTEANASIKFTTILVGFNHIDVARKTNIENYDKSMYDIVQFLKSKQGNGAHFILNPIIGPEPITGSTRMKGGSATKILIEIIFAKLFQDVCKCNLIESTTPISTASIIHAYETSYRFTYHHIDSVSHLIDQCGNSLKKGGRVVYVSQDTTGILGVIDASECPPTYGAAFNDVRGFINGGWDAMQNFSGDMSSHGSDYQLAEDYFLSQVLPQMKSDDTIIYLSHDGLDISHVTNTIDTILSINGNVSLTAIHWTRSSHKSTLSLTNCNLIEIKIPHHDLIKGYPILLEFSVKLVLNALSTGGHTIKGKVWKNRMIDLSLSNNKLFFRGIDLVSNIMNVTKEISRACILKAIYGRELNEEEISSIPVSRHIEEAMKIKKIIPTAMLLSSKKFSSVAEAKDALDKEPILRNLISKMAENQI